MKYTEAIEIAVPRDHVVRYFDSSENLYQWQPELVSFEHESGDKGQVGARSRLVYQMGKRRVEMIETITDRDLPERFSGNYEADGVKNRMANQFEAVDQGTTRWTAENEFHCKGFMKIMTWLMPGAFRKQTRKYMENFKQFAERSYANERSEVA